MTQSADGPRRRRRVTGVAVPLSILLGSLLVWQSSQAAYSATTNSSVNTWNSGSVTNITNTMTGGVNWTVSNIRPDSADTTIAYPGFAPDNVYTGETRCVEVVYTGGAAKIRMYATLGGNAALQGALIVKVDRGSGATNSACASYTTAADVYNTPGTTAGGVLSGFPATFTTASATEWTVTGNDSAWYRISWLMPAGTGNASSGLSATATFTWEAQVN
ncbi:helicase [Actinoplanes xinjiangensis]|uniref:Ribosomally synthesized peptide with SipW-like signal peptide n=1 Tax=Actinoplanes xinjiangensis TaxID=512350 RepID=A0A316FXF4_9ACTN|nr:helicase [Actinoplanes xinjiangensis]PWK52356.1 hypothetical protein BC793_101365 [Actinoplanes xinjiangensis]GIF36943.1 hypothetical protein Axi01nite_12540 [Actinoplanes xinjiangensis]